MLCVVGKGSAAGGGVCVKMPWSALYCTPPVLPTSSCFQLAPQWPRHKLHLIPSVKLVAPMEKPILERAKLYPRMSNQGKKISVRISPATPRWEKKKGGGVPWARAEISLQPLETPWCSRYLLAAHGKGHARAGVCKLQPMEDTTPDEVDTYWRKLQPVESPCWSRFVMKEWSSWRGPTL